MRKNIILIFVLFIMCLLLNSCIKEKADSNPDGAMQELYNRSTIARKYADKEFDGFLSHFDSNCEILETYYGFYTSETPIYVVGYKYSIGINVDLTYAYKISVDDKQLCTILEEGEDTAGFLFEK